MENSLLRYSRPILHIEYRLRVIFAAASEKFTLYLFAILQKLFGTTGISSFGDTLFARSKPLNNEPR